MKNFAVILTFLLLPLAAYAQDGQVEPTSKRPSPHGKKGDCQVCHLETEETLNSWFTFGSTKRKLRLGLNELCRQCHGVDFGHGVGNEPSQNLRDLPLDAEGKIACAVTCHNMHIVAADPTQNRYHLRDKFGNLCLSCHKK
jgi:hypothetical protein